MPYRLLRQDAHPNCWLPMHASGVPIAKLSLGLPFEPDVQGPVLVRLSAWGDLASDFLERPIVVVSDSMRAALDRLGVDNVQYFKARLQQELSDRIEEGFWLANVIGKVACVDRLASKFEAIDDVEQGELESFRIDPALTCGLDLFRLAEDCRMLVVSPRVQDALASANLRGVLFQDTTTYDGGRAISGSEVMSEQDLDHKH
jgi:hypothetical protein